MRTATNFLVLSVVSALLGAQSWAGDLRINFPKHSEETPVQKLNREGVEQIKKQNVNKAERLFYKAYLIDPDDPFTLNNLGYISELQGKVQRAERYYELAAKENNSESLIAASTDRALQGEKLSQVTGSYANFDLQINRGNVLAMSLLQQGRSQEAEDVLRNTLKLNPRDPFTLNNLGYAMETQGDLQSALRYYNQASVTHSTEPIVVALDPRWRGRPISDVAFRNMEAVRQRLATEESPEQRAARLQVEGVSALNHNEPRKAEDYFRQAYQLNPNSAFSLNNMGYVAETQGDEETAADFYSRAREGEQAAAPVSIASRHEMIGEAVASVAATNDQGAEAGLEAAVQAKRRRHAPVVLLRRDNSPVTGPGAVPPQSKPQTQEVPRPPVDNAPVENTVPRPPQ